MTFRIEKETNEITWYYVLCSVCKTNEIKSRFKPYGANNAECYSCFLVREKKEAQLAGMKLQNDLPYLVGATITDIGGRDEVLREITICGTDGKLYKVSCGDGDSRLWVDLFY